MDQTVNATKTTHRFASWSQQGTSIPSFKYEDFELTIMQVDLIDVTRSGGEHRSISERWSPQYTYVHSAPPSCTSPVVRFLKSCGSHQGWNKYSSAGACLVAAQGTWNQVNPSEVNYISLSSHRPSPSPLLFALVTICWFPYSHMDHDPTTSSAYHLWQTPRISS